MTIEKTNEETDYYIRDRHGDTFNVKTLDEALRHFVGEEGYRLTIGSYNESYIVLRRGVGEVKRNIINEVEFDGGLDITIGFY